MSSCSDFEPSASDSPGLPESIRQHGPMGDSTGALMNVYLWCHLFKHFPQRRLHHLIPRFLVLASLLPPSSLIFWQTDRALSPNCPYILSKPLCITIITRFTRISQGQVTETGFLNNETNGGICLLSLLISNRRSDRLAQAGASTNIVNHSFSTEMDNSGKFTSSHRFIRVPGD